MKHLLFAASVILFTSCSSGTVATSPSTQDLCVLTDNTLQQISFVVDGFGVTNTLVDFHVRAPLAPGDSVLSSDTAIYTTLWSGAPDSGWRCVFQAGGTNVVKIGNGGQPLWLDVTVPQGRDGDYPWTGTSPFGPVGVIISPQSNYDWGAYYPISGHTRIRMRPLEEAPGLYGAYGSFCGVLRNRFGDTLRVTDGRFYR